MGKYRKRPVTIEAMRYDGDNELVIGDWFGKCGVEQPRLGKAYGGHIGLVIATLEGDMIAAPGDWIIRGVAGEFYPVKPHIFEATYEPVTE